MEFRTIDDLNNIIKNNLYKLSDDIDLIVAIPRSGFLPATIISLYLNIPLTDFDNFLNEKIYGIGTTKIKPGWITELSEARKILIVEDSSISGKSLEEAKQKLEKSKYKDKCQFLTIFVTNETKKFTDLYFNICPIPRMFEWNYIHHKGVSQACFDIDGVLCEDPTEQQNDDGEKYIDFLKNAKPKFIPTFKIGYIVTARLEKYRKYTEEWLQKNNIKYDNLIMMDLPSKEERVRLGNHGEFKGKNYKKLNNTNIFIESNYNQALEIARISGKCVFCTENSKFINDSHMVKVKRKIKQEIIQKIKRIIPKKLKKFLKKIIKH